MNIDDFSQARRRCLVMTATGGGLLAGLAAPARADLPPVEVTALGRALEQRIQGRLGFALMDTASGSRWQHRGDKRFAMCSTFKLLLAGAVLAQADSGALSLSTPVRFGRSDLVPHAPVVGPALGEHGEQAQLSVSDLCAAAVEVSDNPAANLLLARTGGPEGLTRFLRAAGDTVTRLDRTEPTLNSNLPDDPRDTTTPVAMAITTARLLTGSTLKPDSQMLLAGWLENASTGRDRIRAGLPPSWRAGDKTGTGERGAINDVAIIWPPGRAAWILAVYTTEVRQPIARVAEVHAALGRWAANQIETHTARRG